LPFEEWASVLGAERLTGALLDRLTHHVHILSMNGSAELCVGRADGVWQLNNRCVHRPAGVVGYRYGNDALYLVVCDDPMHRGQTGSGRLGAKGLLHTG
jgi:hypothetical protein